MPASHRALLLAVHAAAIAVGAAVAPAADTLLYSAGFADGSRAAGGRLAEWHAPTAAPKLNGRPLFDPANPVRWLRAEPPAGGLPADAGAGDSTGTSSIEFFGGDRLPCTVEEYRSGAENWRERQPPHLIVKPLVDIDVSGKPQRATLRVAVDCIRRIVWKPRDGRPAKPATIHLAEGRTIAFRSLRWSTHGVLVLHDQGTERVAFDDIAELQMPARDGWDAYFDTVAMLTPDAASRLMRLETTGGLVATTSFERFRATGNPADPRSWQHLVQPAWCLDPLWLSNPEIRMRRFFMPQEVPLSTIAPTSVKRDAKFGGGWSWQTDRSVQGTPLEARRAPLDPKPTPFGWGFGVQSRCDLVFPLPQIVTAFRSSVALDALARSGGCARASVHANAASEQPLWQSGFLVGSTEVADTGSLSLAGPDGGQKSLVLVADMAHDGRPPGADPYDIRDLVDWLEPVVSLDPEKLKSVVQGRLPQTIAAWQGWSLDAREAETLIVKSAVDPAASAEIAGYRRQVIGAGTELSLDRTWTVAPDHNYLAIAVTRPPGTSASRFEVRIDGQSVAVADIPERKPGQVPPPFLLPIGRFVGKTIGVEVIHLPTDDKSLVEWHAIEPIEDPGTKWQPVDFVDLKSEGGSTFTRLDDGSILVGGPSPATDVQTWRLRTDAAAISAVRIEPIYDASLPAGGPGRSGNGTFVLSGVEAELVPAAGGGRPRKLPFKAAASTYAFNGFGPEGMIDEKPETGWGMHLHPKDQPLAAILVFAEPVRMGNDASLTLATRYLYRERQHVLGRFRLSVTTDPQPSLGIPGTLLKDRLAQPNTDRLTQP
jgi:hypothetical protein